MSTIYQCCRVKPGVIPRTLEVIHEANTEREAIEWLEQHGGGIYRNILHRFESTVEGVSK